jgi:hypothetical protein
VRDCTIRETAPGLLTNEATGQAFTYNDACVQRGPQVGHDAEATAAVTKAVAEFLKVILKP